MLSMSECDLGSSDYFHEVSISMTDIARVIADERLACDSAYFDQ